MRVPAYERRGPDIELMVEQVLGVAQCGSASIFPTQRSMIRCVGHTVVLDRCFLPASDPAPVRRDHPCNPPPYGTMGIPLAPVSLRVMGRSFCSDLPVFDGRRSAVMAFRARYSEVVTRFRSRARRGSCRFAGGKAMRPRRRSLQSDRSRRFQRYRLRGRRRDTRRSA